MKKCNVKQNKYNVHEYPNSIEVISELYFDQNDTKSKSSTGPDEKVGSNHE
jgi:hypothetical protein